MRLNCTECFVAHIIFRIATCEGEAVEKILFLFSSVSFLSLNRFFVPLMIDFAV